METVEKVQYDGVVSALVKYNNCNDENRRFDISAEFQTANKELSSVQSGEVKKEDLGVIASFNASNSSSISVYIYNATTDEEKKNIFNDITDFISDVKAQIEK